MRYETTRHKIRTVFEQQVAQAQQIENLKNGVITNIVLNYSKNQNKYLLGSSNGFGFITQEFNVLLKDFPENLLSNIRIVPIFNTTSAWEQSHIYVLGEWINLTEQEKLGNLLFSSEAKSYIIKNIDQYSLYLFISGTLQDSLGDFDIPLTLETYLYVDILRDYNEIRNNQA